jgi:2-amino-4-hydroxy-6-hydroxymethyldihydropteridine diphosphokinase
MIPGGVVIALGANLGDPIGQLRQAFDQLDALAAEPVRRSSLWETSPVDCPPGSPKFTNAVALFTPCVGETPESLLVRRQAAEKELGRRPKLVLNEARPLDLDLIAWAGETRATPALTLPHPRAHQREFVLRPLAELAPELVLPGQVESVVALLAKLPPDPRFRRVA